MTNNDSALDQPRETDGKFGTKAHGESGVSLVEIPAQKFNVLDGPATLTYALQNLDEHGRFNAVVRVPADEMSDHDIGYDGFYDGLSRHLISDSTPYALDYQIVGVEPNGRHMFVEMSQDIAEMYKAEPDLFDEVPDEVLAAHEARFTNPVYPNGQCPGCGWGLNAGGGCVNTDDCFRAEAEEPDHRYNSAPVCGKCGGPCEMPKD